MAKYNEILAGRLNNALKKFLSMKGPAPSPQIASEFAPTFALFWGVENRFLEEWQRFATVNVVTGGAGQIAGFRFRNPTGSNIIAVFEKIVAGATAAAEQPTVEISLTNTDLTTVRALTTSRVDSRGRPQPTLIHSSTTNYAAPLAFAFLRGLSPAGQSYDFITDENQELTVLPGDSLDIFSNVNAQAFTMSALWRERVLEESERQ
jgi:hypothetical protein